MNRAAGIVRMENRTPPRVTLSVEILLLAIIGGGVDAVILLGFGVLTAAQTGDTMLLAVALSQRHFATGLLYLSFGARALFLPIIAIVVVLVIATRSGTARASICDRGDTN